MKTGSIKKTTRICLAFVLILLICVIGTSVYIKNTTSTQYGTNTDSSYNKFKSFSYYEKYTAAIEALENDDASTLTKLIEAGLCNDTEKAKQSNSSSNNVSDVDNLLSHAIRMNSAECIHVLLSAYKSDLRKDSKNCKSHLSRVAEMGNLDILNIFIQNDFNLNTPDPATNWTPLMYAAANGHKECVELLISNGAYVNYTSPTFGWTALYKAAENGHASCVKLLIDAGARIDAKSPLGWTPLYEAAIRGHAECVELLLDAGANPNIMDEVFTPNSIYKLPKTMQSSAVPDLMELGLSEEQACRIPEWSILYQSLQHPTCARLILAKINELQGANKEETSKAASNVFIDRNSAIELLRQKGYSTKSATSYSSLYWAADAGDATRVRLLLSAGAPIETPEEYQTMSSSTPLQRGLGIAQNDNDTPLSTSARNGDDKCLKLLIEAGAYLHDNKIINNPFQNAIFSHNSECVKLLLAARVYPNAIPLFVTHVNNKTFVYMLTAGMDLSAENDLNHETILEHFISSKLNTIMEATGKDEQELSEQMNSPRRY